MKDKTLNEINYIKNGTITKIKNVKKYMIDNNIAYIYLPSYSAIRDHRPNIKNCITEKICI